ncbi:MAG: hypothetical protein RIS94_1069 [Pseudomonadota bacterium]|jgi:hypothetical protein
MDMGFNESWPLHGDAGTGAEGLRPLAWSDLCARLSAAQDLRREEERLATQARLGGRQAGGSFHLSAALWLRRDESNHGEEAEADVNPMPSANGKVAGATTGVIAEQSLTPFPDEISRRELP